MRINKNGFTIVELLIVIVVIGILATITVVAFNGIQQRARNTQIIAGTDIYKKSLISFAIVNGRYPYGSTSNVCLGTGYTTDNICVSGGTVGGQTIYAEDTTFHNQLAPFMPTKPLIGGALQAVGNSNVTGSYLWNGRIFYHLEGTGQNCSLGGNASTFGPYTRCDLTLPSPSSL